MAANLRLFYQKLGLVRHNRQPRRKTGYYRYYPFTYPWLVIANQITDRLWEYELQSNGLKAGDSDRTYQSLGAYGPTF